MVDWRLGKVHATKHFACSKRRAVKKALPYWHTILAYTSGHRLVPPGTT